MRVERVTVEIKVAELYTVKASTYGTDFGMTVRGAQKAFKRLHAAEKKVPTKYGAIAGLPIVEYVGNRLFMLEPYFDAIRSKRVTV